MESNKTDLKNYEKGNFKIKKNRLIQILWYFTNVLFFKNALNPLSKPKVILLRLFGAEVGEGVVIKPSVNIKYPWKLNIGNYVWIGEKVWIDNLEDVIISDNSVLSQGAVLICGNHNYKSSGFDLMTGKITLEEGVWIGAGAMIFGNSRCESHSILQANSVISGNMEKYSIYRGNPASLIKKRIIK